MNRTTLLPLIAATLLGCSGSQNTTETTPDPSTAPAAEETPAPAVTEAPTIEPVELSAAQQELVGQIDSNLSYYTEALQTNCGLELQIDWKSFADAEKLSGLGSTIASACQGAMALAEKCGEPASKTAVTSKLSGVICSHVEDRADSGLSIAGDIFLTRVVIEETGADGKPAAYFAPTRVDTLNFLEKNL